MDAEIRASNPRIHWFVRIWVKNHKTSTCAVNNRVIDAAAYRLCNRQTTLTYNSCIFERRKICNSKQEARRGEVNKKCVL